ncbi:branched-chain amino acid ABC transporter permease [Xanthobacter sp. DSM 24535]|uniref:branched-chain amino acid ABC transporter permease n=1 Tax=Roseixanthobacter psychrophilus TaxID=3119917 RepID=UPI00372C429F
MQHYIEILLNGLVSGGYYAAMAAALSLVFGINKVVNFAHGEFIMVGGFAYFTAATFIGAFPAYIAAFVCALIIGYVFHLLVFRRRSLDASQGFSSGEYQIITTFALGMLLLNGALMVYGPDIHSVAPAIELPRVRSSVLFISGPRLFGLIQCLLYLALLYLFLTRTSIGRLLRAASQNPAAMSTLGVDAERFDRNVFAACCGLAGLTGAFIAPVFAVYPEAGAAFALKSFVVVVLGGFGSFTGTIVGGLLFGVIESFGGALISSAYKDVFGFVLLLVVLLVSPNGLLGERVRGV